MDLNSAVQERYSAAAREHESGLCCPVGIDPALLKIIPRPVLERDYGCGDPAAHVRSGETVLDLGCGGGKVCFIASQVTGKAGRVIGVDVNDDMLALARWAQPEVAERLGYDNVEFRKGRIEDLRLDRARLDAYLAEHPVCDNAGLTQLEQTMAEWRAAEPLVADSSVDTVISNCVLNLVLPDAKQHMFAEIARVLAPGGRAVISDIVADRDVPAELATDPRLWSSCYAGAMREDRFVSAFAAAGLAGTTVIKREAGPCKTIDDVEFRSLTVAAWKPLAAGPDGMLSRVLYAGPFASVTTDSGLVLKRAVTTMVPPGISDELTGEPYSGQVLSLDADATSSCGCGSASAAPAIVSGSADTVAASCCGPGDAATSSCCDSADTAASSGCGSSCSC
jgi:ubiquinone/menaquinone biosynthesis C-methylase UbiE